MINLMLPTRERLEKCIRFCESAIETCDNPKNIVITIATDCDDPTALLLRKKLDEKFSNIIYLECSEVNKFPGLVYYWNKIIAETHDITSIYGMVGDDMVFTQSAKGWDSVVLNYFDSLKDKLGLIHFNSASHYKDQLCINSFIHKRYIELNGEYVDNDLKANGTDNYLYTIFSDLNRIKYVDHMIIDHIHHFYKKCDRDKTSYRRESVDKEKYNGKNLRDFINNIVIPRAKVKANLLRKHLEI